MKFDEDIDKKPVLGVYLQKPLYEKKEDNTEEDQEYQPFAKFNDDPLFKNLVNYELSGNYIYAIPKVDNNVKREIVVSLNKSEEKAFVYQPQSVLFKKKKVLFMNKTFVKEEDFDEDKKDLAKKTIKFVKRNNIQEELVLKKRKYEEMRLRDLPLAKVNEGELNQYVDEADDLEEIRKKIIEEEQEIENLRSKTLEEEEETKKEEDNQDDPATKELADFFMEEEDDDDDSKDEAD